MIMPVVKMTFALNGMDFSVEAEACVVTEMAHGISNRPLDRAVPALVAETVPVLPRKKRIGKPVKAKPREKVPTPPISERVTDRVTTEASVPARVFDLISKGPARTSGELYDWLRKKGFTGAISAVYSACHALKEKGRVVVKPDDSESGGGVMKYFPA